MHQGKAVRVCAFSCIVVVEYTNPSARQTHLIRLYERDCKYSAWSRWWAQSSGPITCCLMNTDSPIRMGGLHCVEPVRAKMFQQWPSNARAAQSKLTGQQQCFVYDAWSRSWSRCECPVHIHKTLHSIEKLKIEGWRIARAIAPCRLTVCRCLLCSDIQAICLDWDPTVSAMCVQYPHIRCVQNTQNKPPILLRWVPIYSAHDATL